MKIPLVVRLVFYICCTNYVSVACGLVVSVMLVGAVGHAWIVLGEQYLLVMLLSTVVFLLVFLLVFWSVFFPDRRERERPRAALIQAIKFFQRRKPNSEFVKGFQALGIKHKILTEEDLKELEL